GGGGCGWVEEVAERGQGRRGGRGRGRRPVDGQMAGVAPLVARGIHDGDLLRLEEGEVVVAQGDEPLPLRVGEKTLAARVVRGGILAAEQLGDEGRREIVVRGASRDTGGRLPRPAQDERRAELGVAE